MKNWVFFTGVPGSRWSGVAKLLCQHPSVDNTDCSEKRSYRDMHFGNYFGPGMEHGKLFQNMNKLHPNILIEDLESPYTDNNYNQIRFLKGHIFAYHLDFIEQRFRDSKIMIVYRNDELSLNWWLEAGGFDIPYPKYDWYVDEATMLEKIKIENQHILTFVNKHNKQLEPFTTEWIKQNFDWNIEVNDYFIDISVALL